MQAPKPQLPVEHGENNWDCNMRTDALWGAYGWEDVCLLADWKETLGMLSAEERRGEEEVQKYQQVRQEKSWTKDRTLENGRSEGATMTAEEEEKQMDQKLTGDGKHKHKIKSRLREVEKKKKHKVCRETTREKGQ